MNNSKLVRLLTIRLLAMGFVLYYLLDIIRGYLRGGVDAPSTLLVVLSAVLLGGGTVLIGVMTWNEYKRIKAEEEKEKQDREALCEEEQETE